MTSFITFSVALPHVGFKVIVLFELLFRKDQLSVPVFSVGFDQLFIWLAVTVIQVIGAIVLSKGRLVVKHSDYLFACFLLDS